MSAPADAPNTLQQGLAWAQTLGLDRLDAQVLMMHALGRPPWDRAWLLAHDTDPLPARAWPDFVALCQRRLSGEPVAYLVGQREFYGLTLQVNAHVLDPRPDTETLVDWALDVLQDRAQPVVLDLGTGSGAIALALQHTRRDAHVTAIDASPEALAVAQANATRLGLPVRCLLSHWLQNWNGAQGSVDLVVSNPPYIAEGDPHLAQLQHEPTMALTSGPDGLRDIRTIVQQALAVLKPGGWLLLEHGFDQADAVAALLAQAGYAQVQHKQDLAGHRRCTGAQKPAHL
jgi:release factor glutamine methyltransferase